jgi:addiction module HigA family antidote
MKAHAAIHPGEILFAEFLEPLGITQYRLAKAMGVPAPRVNEIVLGKRGISGDTALRLSKALGTSAKFWMNLQSKYELDLASDSSGLDLSAIVNLVSKVQKVNSSK